MKSQVILVDDSPVFLDGMESLFAKADDYELIEKHLNGEDLLRSRKLGNVDLILLDIELPGKNGVEIAKRLNYLFPEIKLIAITMYQDNIYLQQLLEAGFKGFINKTKVGEKFFPVMNAVIEDEFQFPDDIEI